MKQRNTNTCERMRCMLSAYTDGELNKKQTAAVEKHLGSCPSCAREAEQLRTLSALVSDVAQELVPPAHIHASVMRMVKETPKLIPKPKRVWRWQTVGSALAAVCLLTILTTALFAGGVFEHVKMENMVNSSMEPEADSPMNNSSAELSEKVDDGDVKTETTDKETMGDPAPSSDVAVPMKPIDPEDSNTARYTLTRVSVGSTSADILDGEWEADGLYLSFAAQTREVKVIFEQEDARLATYELTDNALLIRYENGDCESFDVKAEGEMLWLARR